jgi:hypothetical protein
MRYSCWRTLKEFCKGLGSVFLQINNQHTQREGEREREKQRKREEGGEG